MTMHSGSFLPIRDFRPDKMTMGIIYGLYCCNFSYPHVGITLLPCR